MMKLPELRGLIYPDEFVIKFFFKNRLHTRTGRVLELGCGNGNNLLLFHEYGWSVIGLDINKESLADAQHNFELPTLGSQRHQFIEHDLARGLCDTISANVDVILLPSILYYIPRHAAVTVLRDLRSYCIDGALVFLRNRTLRDYRYRRGVEVERNGYLLTDAATGEAGLLNVFYDEWELLDMLRQYLNLDTTTAECLSLAYQNPQNGVRVNNADLVIWGQLKPQRDKSIS